MHTRRQRGERRGPRTPRGVQLGVPAGRLDDRGAGLLAFLLATVLNDIILPSERPAPSRMLRVLGTSTMLSFGLGMLSGGTQHTSQTSPAAVPC